MTIITNAESFMSNGKKSTGSRSSEDLETGLTTRSRLRVALVTACWWKLDGVTLTLRKLVRHFKKSNIAVRIYTTDACRPPKTCEDYTTTYIVNSLNLPFWETSQGYKIGRRMDADMRADLEDFDPSVVHVTVPDMVGRDVIYWARRRRVPLVATWHSNYTDYMYHQLPNYAIAFVVASCLRLYLINIYTQVNVTYVPTEFVRRKMIREGFEIADVNRLGVWGRGVDMTNFNPNRASASFRRKHGIAPDAVVVLWVGRVVREKGTDIWLECLERLGAQRTCADGRKRDIVGLVVGTGTEVKKLCTCPHVKTIGWVYSGDLGEVYASSDIFLFPSAVETFGNVTLEAMASGLPVVVDKGCSGHLVDDGRNGYGCKSEDVDAYVDAVRRLVDDPLLRKRMGRSARAKATAFDNQTLAQKMVENYKHEIYLTSRSESESSASRGILLPAFDRVVFVGTVIFIFLIDAVRWIESCRVRTVIERMLRFKKTEACSSPHNS